jgi:hypothetical protein
MDPSRMLHFDASCTLTMVILGWHTLIDWKQERKRLETDTNPAGCLAATSKNARSHRWKSRNRSRECLEPQDTETTGSRSQQRLGN